MVNFLYSDLFRHVLKPDNHWQKHIQYDNIFYMSQEKENHYDFKKISKADQILPVPSFRYPFPTPLPGL